MKPFSKLNSLAEEAGESFRVFIFDLDGTLLDTLADIATACNVVLGRHEYPQHPVADYAMMVGNGFETLIQRALPQARMPDACALQELVKEARSYYAGHMENQTRPYPGMIESLKNLVASGCKLGMLSNKPDALARDLIGHYFPEIPFFKVQGALPDVPLKPDPSALLAMLAAMDAKLAEACYVGDSDVDIQTAKNAAIAAIGAGWGFRGPEELEQAGALVVLERPNQLPNLISSGL